MRNIINLVLILALGLFLAGCKTAEKFTVTFMNGDAEIVSVEVKKGADATAPTNPSKTGFVFTGWDKAFTSVEGDLVVNAIFTVKTFQVQFKVDGENYGEVVLVKYGEDAVMPATPEKEGYVFLAWDKEAKNVTENLVVNATFEDSTYSVIFRVDGVQVGETQTITHGEAAAAPSAPVKTGHTFTGWDKEFAVVTGDLIVSAEFDALTYTVRFYLDEENLIGEAQTVAYGQAAFAPTAPEQVGFAFSGWDKAFNNITGDLDVTAIYVVATFTVKFIVEGVQVGADQVLEYGQDAVAPASPTKLGYNFTGWSIAFANVTENLIVNALFSIVTYEIKYFDGTTELIHSPATYTVEDAFEFVEYEKTGFLFVGWFESRFFEQTSLDGIVLGSTGNVTVNGKWVDPNLTYAVSFELNDGAWTWTSAAVTLPAKGIDVVSDLPELFMQDFFNYLSANNLLESEIVNPGLRATTFEEFSRDCNDPRALYNWTGADTAHNVTFASTDGYSQFFWDTVNPTTADAKGGFFGTEPYKAKYVNLLHHLINLYVCKTGGTGNNAYIDLASVDAIDIAKSKSGAGFILDGYFYGTQGITGSMNDPLWKALRETIPNTNLKWIVNGNAVTSEAVIYPVATYIQGLSYVMPIPSKERLFKEVGSTSIPHFDYLFVGWYDNAEFTGTAVAVINADVVPATKYFAKWQTVELLEIGGSL